VADEVSALIVPPADPARLAAALVCLAGDPELRRRLGQQALREARQRHDEQVTARQYQALYDEVAGSGQRATGSG
jgi:glycosyltransferase involved in cell wall biosynthesis